MKRRVLIPILLALLMIVIVAPAALAGPRGPQGRLDDTIIDTGETVNNDVIVLDGDLTVRHGAVVNGDVVVVNGDAFVDGQVNGSLTLFNGDLEAGEAAAISGDCVLLNGEFDGPNMRGACTAVETLELPPLTIPETFVVPAIPAQPEFPEIAPLPTMPAPAEPARPAQPAYPDFPQRGPESAFGIIAARTASIIASSLLFALLGLFVGAVMPNQLRQIVATARNKPMTSGMAGVLTAIAVPSLIVLLIPLSILLTLICIGLLGFPIMVLLAVALLLGSVLGWVVVGTWLGVRLFGRGKDDHIVRAAGLGTGLMTLGLGGLSYLPFVGGLIVFIVASIGLGAVALTQFGMKPYPRRPQAGPGDDPNADKVDVVLHTLPPEERMA